MKQIVLPFVLLLALTSLTVSIHVHLTSQMHQEGANLLCSADGSNFFIVWEGKIRKIPPTVLSNLFDRSKYTARTQAQLNAFTCGPDIDPNAKLVMVNGDPSVYFINYGNRYHVNDPQTMTDFGFDWAKIKSLRSQSQIGCYIDYGLLRK